MYFPAECALKFVFFSHNKQKQIILKMSNFVSDLLCQEIQNAFYCDDGKEIEIIVNSKSERCCLHKSLLCALSPLLRECLKEEANFVIILPDIEEVLLQRFCEMVYLGQLKLNDSEQLENVNQALENLFGLFGIKSTFVQENVGSHIEDTVSEVEVAPSQEEDFTPQIIKSELTYHCTVKGCVTSHFLTHVALRKHVEMVHHTFTFACHFCNKRFRNNFTLKEHVKIHQEIKPHFCDICGKRFSTKNLYSSHTLSHGERKFE